MTKTLPILRGKKKEIDKIEPYQHLQIFIEKQILSTRLSMLLITETYIHYNISHKFGSLKISHNKSS